MRDDPVLDWSTDSRTLVFAVPHDDTVRLGTWRPDTPREPVTVLPTAYPADSPTTLTTVS